MPEGKREGERGRGRRWVFWVVLGWFGGGDVKRRGWECWEGMVDWSDGWCWEDRSC